MIDRDHDPVRLQVVAVASNDLTGWLEVDPSSPEPGPYEQGGWVAWERPPTLEEDHSGRIWVVFAKQRPYRKGDEGPRWWAEGKRGHILSLVDVHKSDEDVARRQLTEQGMYLSHPPTSEAAIWLASGILLGPVSLEPVSGKPDYWRLPPKLIEVPLPELHGNPEPSTINVDGGLRLVTGPSASLAQTGQSRDWRLDPVFIPDFLARLRNLIGAVVDFPEESLHLLEETLSTARVADHFDKPSQMRLLAALNDGRVAATEREQLIELVRTSPNMQQWINRELEAAVAAERARRFAVLEQEVAAQRQAVFEEIDAHKTKIEELQRERILVGQEARAELEELRRTQADITQAAETARTHEISLNDALERLNLETQRRLQAFEEALDQRIESAMERTLQHLAHDMADHVTQSEVSISNRPPLPITGFREIAAVFHVPTDVTHYDNPLDLVSDCCDEARERGLPSIGATQVLGSLLAGAVPIVVGGGARMLMEAIADVIAGGNLLIVPITPTTLEPADLLGRSDSTLGCVVPAASGLLDALLGADALGYPGFVLFDGINRAPVESYLAPLLDLAYLPGEQTYSLVHHLVVGPDDPYRGATRLTWPQQLLIAATLTDGPTTFPLPASIWGRAVLIDLDSARGGKGVDKLRPNTSGAIAWSQWAEFREQTLSAKRVVHADEPDISEEIDKLPREVRRMSTRYDRALRLITEEQEERTKIPAVVVTGVVLPWLIVQRRPDDASWFLEECDLEPETVLPRIARLIGEA